MTQLEDRNPDFDAIYRLGESSGYADWAGALMEVLPDEVDVGSPTAVAEYVATLLRTP